MLDLIEGYFGGQREAWDAAVPELLTPDVEIIPSSALASGTAVPYSGHSGARLWLAEVAAEWPSFRTHPQQLVDLPPDKVLVLGMVVGEGQGARGYATLAGCLCTLRSGRLSMLQHFSSHAEPLRELGLPETRAVRPGAPR